MAGNYIDKWNANGQMYDIQDAGRGLPNGVATLDLNGRVPYSQLPESAVEFKGYWNATTNTPTLADGTGTKGDMYYVDVAGIRDLGSGTQRFYVGDRVLYDGSVWKNMNPDLIDLFLPVGHLIWTSNVNFNPNTQYPGTTWTQIKDRFVLAAGDTYSNSAIGGAATVTLTRAQMPSHTHLFVPSGTVSRTGNSTVNISGRTEADGVHSHSVKVTADYVTGSEYDFGFKAEGWGSYHSTAYAGTAIDAGSHSHYLDLNGTITDGAWSFTGTQGSTGTDGENEAHNNMPPYIVKYCWERTA